MAARGDLPFDRRDVEAWLRARGTERIEHPGGTLHDHLRRVATLLGDWGAGPLLEAAGLCHACYGTDGYRRALLDLGDRKTLAALIGGSAEALVYLYGSCDRAVAYPQLAGAGAVRLRDRFTGKTHAPDEHDVRGFAELTAANELDVLRHNEDLATSFGPELFGLIASV